MGYRYAGGSHSYHKETIHARASRSQASPTSSNKPRETKAEPFRKECDVPLYEEKYYPHHRNLGLKPWASMKEVKTARNNIMRQIHPDKMNNKEQRKAAEEASILVNKAYEKLAASGGRSVRGFGTRFGAGYPYTVDNWENEPGITSNELRRRLDPCSNVRKAWYRPYKTYKQCAMEGMQDMSKCDEFLVNLSYKITDNVLPFSLSDAFWAKMEGMQGNNEGGLGPTMIFYGGGYRDCEEGPFVVHVPSRSPLATLPRSQSRHLHCHADTDLQDLDLAVRRLAGVLVFLTAGLVLLWLLFTEGKKALAGEKTLSRKPIDQTNVKRMPPVDRIISK